MKEFILKYKRVIKFLTVFSLCYVFLYIFYVLFLKYDSSPDVFTKLVSKQTVAILNQLDYNTTAHLDTNYNHIGLYINNKLIAGIAEGCNAISIMILFIAFIVAFAKSLKKTALFGCIGLLIIYAMNVSRIVILIICLYHFPEYSEPLHSIIFPAMIYSAVFLLWMYWVKSFKTTTNAT